MSQNNFEKQVYCRSGSGLLKINHHKQITQFRFSSIQNNQSWLVGLEVPLVGEIPIRVNKKSDDPQNFRAFQALGISPENLYSDKFHEISALLSLFCAAKQWGS